MKRDIGLLFRFRNRRVAEEDILERRDWHDCWSWFYDSCDGRNWAGEEGRWVVISNLVDVSPGLPLQESSGDRSDLIGSWARSQWQLVVDKLSLELPGQASNRDTLIGQYRSHVWEDSLSRDPNLKRAGEIKHVGFWLGSETKYAKLANPLFWLLNLSDFRSPHVSLLHKAHSKNTRRREAKKTWPRWNSCMHSN